MVVEEPSSESQASSPSSQAGQVDMDVLIAKCIKQILQILKDREER